MARASERPDRYPAIGDIVYRRLVDNQPKVENFEECAGSLVIKARYDQGKGIWVACDRHHTGFVLFFCSPQLPDDWIGLRLTRMNHPRHAPSSDGRATSANVEVVTGTPEQLFAAHQVQVETV